MAMKDNYSVNVIIAEDEDIIRNGLVNSIPWEDLGFRVVGVASNGKEALACYQSTKAELIITDIKMPYIDGLELLEKLVELGSTAKVIIISGYDEFNYAQKALKLGAYDYILKPIKLEQFIDMLSRLHKKIGEQKNTEMLINSAKKADTNKQLLGALCESDPSVHQEYISSIIHDSFFSVALLQLESFDIITSSFDYLQLRELDSEFEDLFTKSLGLEGFIPVKRRLGELIIIIISNDLASLERKMQTVSAFVLNTNNKRYSLSASFSSIKHSPEKLYEAYNEALTVNEYRYVLSSDKILRYEKLSSEKQVIDSFVDIDDESLLMVIQSNNHEDINNWFSLILEQIKNKNIKSYFQTVIVVSNIYYRIMRFLLNNNNEIIKIYLASSNPYAKIIKQKTTDEMIKKLAEVVIEIADLIDSNAKNKYSDSFIKAKNYVLEHYADANLTLEMVADYAGMGACYLSSMFKQKTNKTFIELLTHLRMKKALELLLNTELLVYEISEKVGYQNPTYFSTVFKKYYGKSPKDFREK